MAMLREIDIDQVRAQCSLEGHVARCFTWEGENRRNSGTILNDFV